MPNQQCQNTEDKQKKKKKQLKKTNDSREEM